MTDHLPPPPHPLRRAWHHLWLDASDARQRITPAGLQRLEQAVRDSESRHRGELRVCIEGGLGPLALWRGVQARDRAIALFSALRVWDTADNNGVLIYLLLAERRIELLADRGLSEKVPAGVWADISATLSQALQRGDFERGLQEAIEAVGALLRTHCPRLPADRDVNELPDAIVLI
jgi:uncharacterized membrane protein